MIEQREWSVCSVKIGSGRKCFSWTRHRLCSKENQPGQKGEQASAEKNQVDFHPLCSKDESIVRIGSVLPDHVNRGVCQIPAVSQASKILTRLLKREWTWRQWQIPGLHRCLKDKGTQKFICNVWLPVISRWRWTVLKKIINHPCYNIVQGRLFFW